MAVTRHFIGWDQPVTHGVRAFLLPEEPGPITDLRQTLVVVPTRQASRRLRESLARFCSEQRSALFPPRMTTPPASLRPEPESRPVAGPSHVLAIWADILSKADLGRLTGLFGATLPQRDFAWAMHTGDMIQRLRKTLADGGYRIADVPAACGDDLEEPERWGHLAELEGLFLDRLHQLGLEDPHTSRIRDADEAQLPEGVTRIVIAAVPDPSLLMIRALQNVAGRVPVDILVHAPPSLADHFDAWGRPDPERWADATVDVPDPDRNILLAGTPASQAARALEEIARESGRLGPADVAIGVPDRSVVPFVADALADHRLPAFDPADKRVKDHPLYRLMAACCELGRDGSYKALSTFLRHPDVLDCLRRQHGIDPLVLLSKLDAFQNWGLPLRLEDVQQRLDLCAADMGPDFSPLRAATAFAAEQTGRLRSEGLNRGLRTFLQTVYGGLRVDVREPEGEELRTVARKLDQLLCDMDSGPMRVLDLPPAHQAALLMRALADEEYHRDRTDAVIDLEGWLELTWNDAPLLIVTGMNEGFIPDSRMSDVFLPDSLRRRLDLRDDAQRLARDLFLMRGLIESRRSRGRVCFIAGKTSAAGDPLRPSRLLFRCRDQDLAGRARCLFGAVEEERRNPPSSISFALDPRPPADLPRERPATARLHVTSFRDYLACPFRFYLKHVLGMEALDDEKRGLDALDFGNLVHAALQAVASDADLRSCDDEKRLAAALAAAARDWAGRRYGGHMSLPVMIALDSAIQRLAHAARVQAGLVREGWELLAAEVRLETTLAGITVSGKIDRIDRHADGRVRILDYKTSDAPADPADVHLAGASAAAPEYATLEIAGKPHRWLDLQLPLYRLMAERSQELKAMIGGRAGIEVGYFNLPKAVTNTGLSIWSDFDDACFAGASACAEAVASRIRGGVFWPPAESVPYDDFAALFPGPAEACFDAAAFKKAAAE